MIRTPAPGWLMISQLPAHGSGTFLDPMQPEMFPALAAR
jgi:hypothetical protein